MTIDSVFIKDIQWLCNESEIPFDRLEGKNILVTGATGLIGYNLVMTLTTYSKEHNNNIQVLAFVRSEEKAKRLFGENSNITYVVGDITEKVQIDENIDYIIHGASQTSSKAFVEEPVETIQTAIKGTFNILELAREKKVSGLVYLSSMEVYGSPETDEKVKENHGTDLDTMSVRTSYPESKRMCESLCRAYAGEYAVPIMVARLTQTFGPGVSYEDGRVFAEFARCAIEKKNIILHTKGETKRNYLYTTDAVSAILTILTKGTSGEAYNVANENTYCSIYEMACLVAKECAGEEILVEVEATDISKYGYAPTLKMNLDTSKLQGLGWKPRVNLVDMFKNLCVSMKANR